MNKEFVPYNESLELKELGFDEPCFAYYDEEGDDQIYEYANCNHNVTGNKVCYNNGFQSVTNSQLNNYGAFCSKDEEDKESFSRWTAPTYSQAFRWFREKYGYEIHIRGAIFRASYVIGIPKEINMESADGYPVVISWDYIIDETGERKTYEEAELACLRKLIEIAKQK